MGQEESVYLVSPMELGSREDPVNVSPDGAGYPVISVQRAFGDRTAKVSPSSHAAEIDTNISLYWRMYPMR